MKKHLIINILISIVFIILDPLFVWCGNWADTYSLGAELILGMIEPAVLLAFVIFFIGSACFSFIRCFKERKAINIVPLVVLIAFVLLYVFISTENSTWIRVMDFYIK